MMEVARDRDRLFNKYRNSKKKNNRLYQQAVAKRREFNKLVKNSKDSFYKEEFLVHKANQTKFWELVNNLLGTKSSQKIGT